MIIDKSMITTPKADQTDLEILLRKYAKEIVLPAGKVFISPDVPSDYIYYIVHGRTRHYFTDESGIQKMFYILTDGHFYGISACHLNKFGYLFARTDTRTEFLRIDKAVYRRLLNEPLFRDAIITSLSCKINLLAREVRELSVDSVKDRLKYLLCSAADNSELIDGSWYRIQGKYTQYDLSTMVGAARVTVSKLLIELSNEGIIRVLNRRYEIRATVCDKYFEKLNEPNA